MDRDTIANHIENLSKSKFDNVARLVLTKVFGLDVIDTDRKGDEGFDYIALKTTHDVTVIAHFRRQISEQKEIRCFLTWDAAVIAVARQLKDCGWVVSPVDAADLIQPRLRLASGSLCAIAHALARVQERPAEAAARLIDRIVALAGEKMADWAFRKRVREFRDQALARIDLSQPGYSNKIDEETDRFLQHEGVVPFASGEKGTEPPPDEIADRQDNTNAS